jgi:predicted Zn finger-like uncharacterized protein
LKKWIHLILALFVVAAFSSGCAGMPTKQQQVKCPKCGATFTVDERARGQETR